MRDRTREREEHASAEGRRRAGNRELRNDGHGPPRRPAHGVAPHPRPRGRVRTTIARVVGRVATLVLLAVGVAVLKLVTKDNPPKPPETFAAPTPPRQTARDKRARPHAPRLTPAQRASRNAAVKQMRTQGFEPVRLADYHPRQNLRVLIGRPKPSTGVHGRRAFFFVRGDYLGTDAASPSLRVRVVRQSANEITLAYKLFAPGDKPCCPKAGTSKVRFTMADGRLVPEDAIPPVASRMPSS